MGNNDTFEVCQYSVTDKSQPLKRPSYGRVNVAITLTSVLMVICAVFISIYTAEYTEKKNYYSTGNSDGTEVYEYSDAFGGVTVIGEPFNVLEFTETVSRGEWATVRIQGEPNTEYDITVFLKSGPSSNSALIPKKSDEHGVVEWKWRIYSGTSTGKFKIVIKNMYESNVCVTYAEMYLNIISEK